MATEVNLPNLNIIRKKAKIVTVKDITIENGKLVVSFYDNTSYRLSLKSMLDASEKRKNAI